MFWQYMKMNVPKIAIEFINQIQTQKMDRMTMQNSIETSKLKSTEMALSLYLKQILPNVQCRVRK